MCIYCLNRRTRSLSGDCAYINDASECARVFESERCANLRVLSQLARARVADNNWPSSGRGAGVTTRSGGSIYITIFYAQAVVVIDTYSKTLNDNDSACCWIDIFDSFLLSPGAKRGLPRAATLEEFPAFQRKVVAIPAAARSNIFLMRDTFSLLADEKIQKCT
jgi:hypothetical protein